MALKVTYRFPSPQQGQPAPTPPAQVQNEMLEAPTDQTIRDLAKMNAEYPGMTEKIGHHYVQALLQSMNKQGMVFGPQGSTFSGHVDLS